MGARAQGQSVSLHGRVRGRHVVLSGVLLLLAWLGWNLLRIVTGRPGIFVDYTLQMTAICEQAQPQGENG